MATWGSLKKDASIPAALHGKGQGYFRYYRTDGTYEYLVAVGGKLIREGGVLNIEGLPEGFQKDKMVEAVQWKNILFIATGTKLVEYDGTFAKVVKEYKPKPLEYLYVGSNALAPFPDNFMEDGVDDVFRVEGIFPTLRKGVANTPVTFTAYVSQPDPPKKIEYKWEYKLSNRDTFILGRDWSEDRTWEFTPQDIGDYTIQVSARQPLPVSGEVPDPKTAQLPIYKVTPFDENDKLDSSLMHTCNRILLHWNRIILYGDQKNHSLIYISHLDNPRYFPKNNSIDFENNEQEPLQKLVRYRNFLVAFMPSSIQALYGNSPIGDEAYQRAVIHTGLGCIAPETAKVMGNYITFLSKEGIHILKSFGTVESKMNVEKIDSKISNLVHLDTNACAVVFENQYHICYPDRLLRLRYYMELDAWVKDESPLFDFSNMFEWNGELVAQSLPSGKTYMFDESACSDVGHTFEARMVSKQYDFGEPHNLKKLKNQHLILTNDSSDRNVMVEVKGDNNNIITAEEAELVTEVNEDTNVTKILLSPQDKVRTVQTVVRHATDESFHLLALGYIFKVRKP